MRLQSFLTSSQGPSNSKDFSLLLYSSVLNNLYFYSSVVSVKGKANTEVHSIQLISFCSYILISLILLIFGLAEVRHPALFSLLCPCVLVERDYLFSKTLP